LFGVFTVGGETFAAGKKAAFLTGAGTKKARSEGKIERSEAFWF